MGIFNKAIPNIRSNNLNQVRVSPVEEYYVDDIFDPLFNAEVKKQLNAKYGNPIGATIGGYLEGIDNALVGQNDKWGILGPGMGILSGFGRSMDKAGDFILGGITEGVKFATGQGFESPIRNIFVEDEDYSGTRLLAAMGNSMAGIADAPKLNETDFKGLWNVPGLGIDLITDPGIAGTMMSKGNKVVNLGEQVANQQANSRLADIGSILADYDDLMAKVSFDLTAPGLRQSVKALRNKISQKFGTSSAKPWADTILNKRAPYEDRVATQKAMRADSETTSYIEMADELDKAEQAITEAESLNKASENVPMDTATAGTVLNDPVSKTPALSNEALQDLENSLLYDKNTVDWILSSDDADDIIMDYVRRAYTSNIDELISDEVQQNTVLYNLAKAISASNTKDVTLQAKQLSDFLESDWAKKNIVERNPNMYAHAPDDFDLSELDVFESSVYKPFGADTATVELYNRIHDLARKQYSTVSVNARGTKLDTYVSAYNTGKFDDIAELNNLNKSERTLFKRYVKRLNTPGTFEAEAYKYYRDLGKKDLLFGDSDLDTFADYGTDSLFTEPALTNIPGLTDAKLKKIVKKLDSGSHKEMGYSLRGSEDVSRINPEHLENVLPRELAEKTPQEAPDIYAIYVNRLNMGYDIDNEAARNAVLTQLGFDPKSRRAAFIENTPVTLSPSYYSGRSNTTLKLQAQYANKALKTFTKKYDVNTLIKNPNFKRAFPNFDNRVRIIELLKRLDNPTGYKGQDYFKDVRELTDLILDRQRFLPETYDSLEPSILSVLKENNPDIDLVKELDFERMYPPLASKILRNKDLDYISDIYRKIKDLETQKVSLNKLQKIVDVPYSEIKSRDVSIYRLVKRSGLSKEDVNNYLSVLDEYKRLQSLAVDAYSKDLGLPTNTLLDDLTETAELIQRDVFQPYDRRSGAIRELNPMPRFEKGLADESDELDDFVDYSRGEHKDGSSKYRNRSTNDLASYNIHTIFNNIIRLNKEAFKTPEALAELRKYLGDSYQIKVRLDDGSFKNLSSHIIDSYKKEVLKDLEDVLSQGYTPFMRSENISKLKPGTPAYRLQAALGNVPNVNSPYAKEYNIITQEIVKDSVFLKNTDGTFRQLDEIPFSNKPNQYHRRLPHWAEVVVRNELFRSGVSDPDALLQKFYAGKANNREIRNLSVALQNTSAADYFRSYDYISTKISAENLAKQNAVVLEDFIALKTKQLQDAGIEPTVPRLRKLLKDTSFFPEESTSEFMSDVLELYPQLRSKVGLNFNDVIDYFIEHPTEYDKTLLDLTGIPGAYFQLGYRTKSPKGLNYLGYIDYSSLYGNRQGDLWETLTNKTEVHSPFKKDFVIGENAPKTQIQNAIAEQSYKIKTTPVEAERVANTVVEAIVKAPDSEAAKVIVNIPTSTDAIRDGLLDEFAPNHHGIDEMRKPSPGDSPSGKIPDEDPSRILYDGKEIWLSDFINNAMVAANRASRGDRATLRTDFVKSILDDASILSTRHGVTVEDMAKYKRAQTYLDGAAVKKEEFLDTLASSGFFQLAYKPGVSYSTAYTAIQHNIAAVNSAVGAHILVPFKHTLSNGNTVIGAMWDTSNHNIVNILEKNIGKIDPSKLQDVVRLEKGSIEPSILEYIQSDKYLKINDIFDRIRQSESEFSKMLGFTYDDVRHVKNVRVMSPDVANYLANVVYKDIPVSDLDDLSDHLMQSSAFKHLRGAWGTRKYNKRFVGYIEDFEADGLRIFEDDPSRIVKGSLGDGSFNNSKFQLYVDLFENDNFKINQYFHTPEDLEHVLYATLDDGTPSGNLDNLVLAAPRRDATGRIIGFTQYDKTTRLGLQQALNNSDTVLLPAHVFAPLDRVLRKDAKMSNKLYAFINKHITLPFKFGVLMNPGFLIGNASDAYLKQATTLAHKYGTTVPEELANVAASMRDVMVLNNNFDTAYRKFLTHLEAEGVAIAPSHKISELAASDPRIRKSLMDYINNKFHKVKNGPIIECRLSRAEQNNIRLWMMLNSSSTAASFDSGFQDLDILAKAKNSSKYRKSNNIVDRVLTGDGEYVASDFSTWGLFVNNPLSRRIMDSSEKIENLFRASSILNDFRHKGMDSKWFNEYFSTLDDLKEAAKINPDSLKYRDTIRKKFNVDMSEAINTMHNANFDYERITDFTDSVGTFIPFPTFFIKNLGYWLDVMVEHPQYLDHAITVQESLWGDRDTSEDKFAAEAKGRGAVPISVGGQNLSKFFKGIYKPTPLQSMFGAFSLMNSPVSDLYYRLHPLVSGGLTAASKLPPIEPIAADLIPSEEVKYRPYSTDMYERNVTRNDPNFNPLAYTVHRMNPVERTVQNAIRLPDKLKENKAQLSDFLPSIFQPDF